ncbi:MAG: toll/interleukin-1 receptor domain-containing protein, partial [Bryobacteraceae bacterium]
MRIFVAYASEDRQIAEQLYFVLAGAGHDVFFDKARLPSGSDFNQCIFAEIGRSDVLIFLISPSSLEKGNYALTELRYAQEKWAHPKGHVLPVVIRPVSWDRIPSYLTAVSVIEPEGNVPAEVAHAVRSLTSGEASLSASVVVGTTNIVRLNLIRQER